MPNSLITLHTPINTIPIRQEHYESMKTPPDLGALEVPFRPIGALLRDYASRHPDKIALYDLDRSVTVDFRTLNDVVNRAAATLAAKGVRPGDKVVILSDECLEKLFLFMAVWRAGGVACPFHTEITPDHLRDIIRQIGPVLVLWNRELDGPGLTRGIDCPSVPFGSWSPDCATGTGAFFDDLSDDTLDSEATYGPDDVGCIFATSGTTDRPKCVVWDHLGLWLCGLSTLDFTGMTSEDRLLEYRTFSWLSPQIVAMMPFLQTGMSVFVARRFSHGRFFDWIRDHRITVAAGVPTVINMLLNRPVDITGADIASLRHMTSSSAPLAPDQWRAFEEMYGIKVIQFYGASEGGWLCGNRHDRRKVGTVGLAAKHMDLAIVDADGVLCPSGEEGEITIRGHQTALATITSEGEVQDRSPFRLTERARTGDLGVVDGDGFITVTGRVKDLIIRGGVNIAPLEVDRALMLHPKVHEAAAFGIPDDIYGEDVACFVVPKQGETVDARDLLTHCAAHLPEAKRPRHIHITDSLIKSERGKVKRDALRDLWLSAPPHD